ncbi:hypothetical protein LTR78_008783 [Recurvomyces mirabilis]|uniref:Cytochrome P450 n=1 Tax=Recurvomyces mirabilis TaxID=574656 RepID=A0AAE0WIN9_9PEZI|nr:hypothetical protein LTR78_008783 [Recurvomyces mirabilis]KAK5160979.1 hypothetical protein LTS14_000773 [Recurvomyces mirabilis]
MNTILDKFPRPLVYSLAPFAISALVLFLVRAYTTLSYYQSLKQFGDSPKAGKHNVTPPQIPYAIPWLGNTTSFLTSKPGHFWQQLFSWYPRSTGVCTLLIGGRKTHILFSPTAVQAMFKARSPSRDVFEQELLSSVFQLPDDQIKNAWAGKSHENEMNSQYLTKHERVNELTTHFTRVLDDVLSKDADDVINLGEIGLYNWIRDRMFTASTTALMGEKLLQMYPEFCQDFFAFDNEFLMFFFALPEFAMREAVGRRTRILDRLQAWSKDMHDLSGGQPVDPEGVAWEPLFGARLNRARQLDYKVRNLNTRSAAAMDLGIVFGLSSNAIPATGWMLMELLKPDAEPTVLPRLMDELREAERPDGSIDVPTLMSQPLLQSVWVETLRLYTDILVTRNLPEDITLPLEEDGKHFVLFKKGDNLFAPSWLGQRDASLWSDKAPYNEFYAERFYTKASGNGKGTFSMATASSGKFFPFGGGKTICPGRVFAKQEALGALAMILLRFEFEVKGFKDMDGKTTAHFPGFAKAFPGSGALVPGGDMMVKIRRRIKS